MMNEVNYETKNKYQDQNNIKNDYNKNEESETLTTKQFNFMEHKRYALF